MIKFYYDRLKLHLSFMRVARKWKMCIVFMHLFFVFAISAKSQTVTLDMKDVTLSAIITKIEKQTGYMFVYDEQNVDVKQKLSITSNKESIENTLEKIEKETNLIYTIDGKNIVLKKAPQEIQQKNKGRKVSGVVLDEKGETIIGATVKIENTQIATITDIDGTFTLDIPEDIKKPVLIVSFLSFETLNVEVNNQSNLSLILKENSHSLDEVVVVGFASQKKASVVGAISSVKSADLIQSPTANISNSLNGRLPGLIAMQRQGEPGRDGAEIYIRGKSTLEGVAASPLCLVDGIERDFTEIDPNEIESISILKDASATAVYGVRGANGVILVTTRSGSEGPAKVQFSAQFGFQTPTRKPVFRDALLTAELYQEGYYNDNKNSDGSGKYFYTKNQMATIKRVTHGTATENEYLQYPNNNWFSELTRDNAPQQQYNINISGGTKSVKYFVSAGYFSQGSYFKDLSKQYYVGDKTYDSNFTFDRYNFRSNVDVNINKDFLVTINLAGRVENINSPSATTEEIYSYLYEFNSLTSPISYPGVGFAEIPNRENPAAQLTQNGFKNETKSTIESTIALKYNLDFLTKGLRARGTISFDSQFGYNERYWEGYDTYRRDWTVRDRSVYQQMKKGSALAFDKESYYNNNKLYGEIGLDYSRTFDKHAFTGLLLYNQQEYRNGANTPYVFQGLVGRVTYGYDSKYLGEINVGYNGSENFAKGKRFGLFPAFSLGWVVSEEPFMKSIQAISNLKIRGTYGVVGNDKLYISGEEQRFLYYSDYIQGGIYGSRFGDNAIWWSGIREGRIGNSNVTWEKSKKSNIGVDASFFKSKLSLVFDLFQESRSDILISQANTIPNTAGAVLPAVNKGKTHNHGYEFELTYRSKIKEVEFWSKLNYTFSKNKIISIDEPTSVAPWQRQEGRPIGQRFMYECIGFFQSEQDILDSPSQEAIGTPGVGDRKYRDYNEDGIIDDFDRFAAGYTDIPEISYGFSFGASYKGFDISVLLQGVSHVTVDFWKGQLQNLEGRWSPFRSAAENANASFPSLHSDSGSGGSRNNSVASFGKYGSVHDGSYLKLKNVEIGYRLSSKTLKFLGISSLRLYANGVNLAILHDKLKYLDPETGSGAATFYPQMRVVNFGLNVTF